MRTRFSLAALLLLSHTAPAATVGETDRFLPPDTLTRGYVDITDF